MSANDPQNMLHALEDAIRPRQRLLTAFSAGVDSTLVALVARRVLGRDAAPAAIGDSPSLPRRELAHARQLAADLDLKLIEITPDEQDDPNYQQNAGDRCYFCKTHLYDSLHRLARQQQIPFIANGTNADDLQDHRPGLKAADEAHVVSPLLEAGLGKDAVRQLARYLALPNADKPAAACLASRLPFGTRVTPQRLQQVEQAENLLHSLGFRGFRVRHHDKIARIELPWHQVPDLLQDQRKEKIIDGLKKLGYLYVTLDLEGFRSGSGNATLTVNAQPVTR